VLNRQRKLSLNMIRRLHTHLHIPLESLIGLSEESSHPRAPAFGKQ
jgi:hypothetical protein